MLITQQNSTSMPTACSEGLIQLCHKHFVYFYNFVWGFSIALMEGKFIAGEHINQWANLFQNEKLLSILSARKHSKSEIAHGYLGWRIFNMDFTVFEKWDYISYSQELAAEHLADAKERIRINPFFGQEGIEDLTDAKTLLYYRKGDNRFFCSPSGILTFKRGKHPHGVITDDILHDPEKRIDIYQITKINDIFMQQVMSMPKEGGLGLRNIGTAQDNDDIFHLLEQRKQFSCRRYPAIISHKDKTVLWPEMFPYERLIQIRDDEIGEKAFGKEYMCVPVRSAEGYFSQEELDSVIYKRLKNQSPYKEMKLHEYCYGGIDLGKRQHPSHISIFGKDRQKRLVQLISIWLDGVDYVEQLSICREICKNYKIHRFYYDDTRAEFEGFKEVGELPAQMKGVCFTKKMKFQIAVEFEKAVKTKTILMLADHRQKRQILNVDNDLKSMETPEGHGDSFWSNALAIQASRDSGPNIRFI